MKFINGITVLAELTMLGGGTIRVALKTKQPAVTACATQLFQDLLSGAAAGGSGGGDLANLLF
jgi:uncharacterized membrane protein YeiH